MKTLTFENSEPEIGKVIRVTDGFGLDPSGTVHVVYRPDRRWYFIRGGNFVLAQNADGTDIQFGLSRRNAAARERSPRRGE